MKEQIFVGEQYTKIVNTDKSKHAPPIDLAGATHLCNGPATTWCHL
jgi:hypothetical protein